jgi:hypothetical protein
MKQSIKQVARAAALTGALMGVTAEAAQAKTPVPNSLKGIVSLIDTQKPSKAGSGLDVATFKRKLANGQEAYVNVQSGAMKSGLPVPEDATSINLLVWNPKTSKALGHISTVAEISFEEQPNGKWDADRQIDDPARSDSVFDISELGQLKASSETLTFAGDTATTSTADKTEVHSVAFADLVLHQLEAQATLDIEHIIHGQAVSPSTI